jgi:hypothetical protein
MDIRDEDAARADQEAPGRTRGSEELRRLLLDAAMDLLREPDTPLDLRKVAERAGKSRTAPYLVFGKESEGGGIMALRIAVAAEGARIMSRMMIEGAGDAGDPLAAFHRVAEAFLDFVERYPRLFRLMYGPDMNAISRLGEDGFREHPEFQQLLEYREIAGQVITDLIEEAQRRGMLPSDPPTPTSTPTPTATSTSTATSTPGPEGSEPPPDPPSVRYLQIAWATMIGIAVLRDDDLLKAVGWDISREQGARVVAESVLGLDPGSVSSAARTFLDSAGVEASQVASSALARPPEADGSSQADRSSDADRLSEVDGPPEVLRAARSPSSIAPSMIASQLSVRPASSASSAASKFADVFGALRRHRPEKAEALGSPPTNVDHDLDHDLDHELDNDVDENVDDSVEHDDDHHRDDDLSLTTVLDSYPGLRRAAYSQKQMASARILWIDDHPAWIANEVKTLEHLGAHIVVVTSTDEALALLAATEESAVSGRRIIISDIARGGVADAGTRAIPRLLEVAPGAAIFFYISDLDLGRGIPTGAAGITNRTDELLHLLLDVLEGR